MSSLLNLKYSLRSLKRNKFSLFINIFGFSVSLAFVIMIGLYVQKEYSVDQFHHDKERIFRVESNEDGYRLAYPFFVLDDWKNQYPQIESGTRVFIDNRVVTLPNGENSSLDVLATDMEFFDVFSFEFKYGHPSVALNDMVINESFAISCFGDDNVVGESIKIEGDLFNISGVIKDFENSHISPIPIMVSADYAINKWPALKLDWYFAWGIYVKTVEDTDIHNLEEDLSQYIKNRFKVNVKFSPGLETVNLRPVTDIYLTSHFPDELSIFSFIRNNDPTFIAVMLIVAILILLFAAINYLNLSVAQSGFRAKSTAIQRLLGSEKRSVFWSFIVESIGILFVSGVFASFMAWLAFPWFCGLMSTQMSFAGELSWQNTLMIATVVLVMGIMAGWVPASIISAFKPIEITSGTFRHKTKSVYSKILITFQYIVTITLLGCCAVIMQQIRFMQNSDLGFNPKNLIVFDYNSKFLPDDATTLVNTLNNIPGVMEVVPCSGYPLVELESNQVFSDKNDVQHTISIFSADSTYLSVLGLKIKKINSHNPNGCWINETAAKQLGIEDATEYKTNSIDFLIRGIVYDFHYQDFTTPIGEIMIQPLSDEDGPEHIIVKVSPTNRAETFRRIREAYNDMAGIDLFNGMFMEEQIASCYKNQTRLSNLLGLLSFVAIVISSMGMLAMSIYFTRQRARDMAVRKVFGATPRGVLGLLMGSFLKLVGVAFVISVPIIYLLMQDWLSGYVYRIKLTPVPFIAAGGIVLVIAVLTVAAHSLKVALSNPVDSLKAE